MIYVDSINVTPNPVETGKSIKLAVKIHEEYEGVKKYPYRYPYRYGDPKKEK